MQSIFLEVLFNKLNCSVLCGILLMRKGKKWNTFEKCQSPIHAVWNEMMQFYPFDIPCCGKKWKVYSRDNFLQVFMLGPRYLLSLLTSAIESLGDCRKEMKIQWPKALCLSEIVMKTSNLCLVWFAALFIKNCELELLIICHELITYLSSSMSVGIRIGLLLVGEQDEIQSY